MYTDLLSIENNNEPMYIKKGKSINTNIYSIYYLFTYYSSSELLMVMDLTNCTFNYFNEIKVRKCYIEV